jgi:hypothetical protein
MVYCAEDLNFMSCLGDGAQLSGQDRDAERRKDGLGPRCHFFNSFFLNKLYKDAREYNYQSVRRWTLEKKLRSQNQARGPLLPCVHAPCRAEGSAVGGTTVPAFMRRNSRSARRLQSPGSHRKAITENTIKWILASPWGNPRWFESSPFRNPEGFHGSKIKTESAMAAWQGWCPSGQGAGLER